MAEDEVHPDAVPDAEEATADERKFTAYLLNENHTFGKSKAKFFRAAGYNESNWKDLRDALLERLPHVPATHSRSNPGGGENYEAVVRIEAPEGSTLDVRTFWEVHPHTGTRLITAYPLDSKERDL